MAFEGRMSSRQRSRSKDGGAEPSSGSAAEAAAPRRRLGARRRRHKGEQESGASQASALASSPARAPRRAVPVPAAPVLTRGTAWRHALLWGLAGVVLVLAAWLGFRAWSARDPEAGVQTDAKSASPLTANAKESSPIRPSSAATPPLSLLSVEGMLARDSRSARDLGTSANTSNASDTSDAAWPLVRLQSNPAVLVLEFPSLHEQGLALNRAAAFIEKKHSAGGQVLGDAEMQRLLARSGDSVATFYFGHDYSAEQLQRFFDRAQAQGLALNPQERRLQALLQAHGLLNVSNPSAAGRNLALVSFTAIQDDDPATPSDEQVDALRRESTLRHELSHGEFFTDARYRRQCWAFWQHGLSEAERVRFRQLLSSMDYDPANEELMVNETQALLMHTPDQRAFNAGSLGLSSAQLEALRDRFRQQQQQ